MSQKRNKLLIASLFMAIICLIIAGCSSDNDDTSKHHHALKLYPVKVTNVKISKDGDSGDSFITIKGTTNAPNGSILYCQRQEKGMLDSNSAYGNDDYKIKKHRFSILLLASNLFDLDKIKVGQKEYVKIFCTNQKIDESDKVEFKDSEFISKNIRNKLKKSNINEYPITVTQKMVDTAQE